MNTKQGIVDNIIIKLQASINVCKDVESESILQSLLFGVSSILFFLPFLVCGVYTYFYADRICFERFFYSACINLSYVLIHKVVTVQMHPYIPLKLSIISFLFSCICFTLSMVVFYT